MMSQEPDDVILPRHNPELEALIPMNRVGLTEVCKICERVCVHLGSEQIVQIKDGHGTSGFLSCSIHYDGIAIRHNPDNSTNVSFRLNHRTTATTGGR